MSKARLRRKKTWAARLKKRYEVRMEREDIFVQDQFENQDNSLAHDYSTGPEIRNAMDGQVDGFVSGIGSGGTLMGTGHPAGPRFFI